MMRRWNASLPGWKKAGQERIPTSKSRRLRDANLQAIPEAPITVPASWATKRMGEIAEKLGAGSTPLGGKSAYRSEGVPFIRSQNVHNNGLRLDEVARIPRSIHEKMAGTHVGAGDLLLNITGASIGRCALVPERFDEGNVSQHVAIVRLLEPAIRKFVHLVLVSAPYQDLIANVQVGVSREGLSMQRLRLFPIPIPPLAEQHRIVEKVDELMAVCDDLAARQQKREQPRDRLVRSTLYQLTDNASATEDAVGPFKETARFYLDNLAKLTTRPEHVKQLRQAILDLAVRGKLVPQDTNDEPTDSLLRRIALEQAERSGNSRRKTRRTDIAACNAAIDGLAVPSTWRIVPLVRLLSHGPQNGISPTPSLRPDAPRAITLSATTRGRFDPLHFKHVEADIPSDSELWLRPGDLLFQRGNTRDYVGIAAYYEGEPGRFLFPDLIAKVRVSPHVSLRYVHLCAVSPMGREYFSTRASGAQATMPNINHKVIRGLPIPLPPWPEQYRIINKVDGLLALCDQLEASLGSCRDANQHLLEAALSELLAAEPRRAVESESLSAVGCQPTAR